MAGVGVGMTNFGIGSGGGAPPPPLQLIAPTNQSISALGSQQIQVTWTDPGFIPISIVVVLKDSGQNVLDSQGAGPGTQTLTFFGVGMGLLVHADLINDNGGNAAYIDSPPATTSEVTVS